MLLGGNKFKLELGLGLDNTLCHENQDKWQISLIITVLQILCLMAVSHLSTFVLRLRRDERTWKKLTVVKLFRLHFDGKYETCCTDLVQGVGVR